MGWKDQDKDKDLNWGDIVNDDSKDWDEVNNKMFFRISNQLAELITLLKISNENE